MNKNILTIIFILLTLNSQIYTQSIVIKNQWARPTSKGRNSAAYFTLINKNNVSDTLISATSKISEKVEIHETYKINNLMGMRSVKYIVLPPKTEIKLKPGGFHIMFINLKKNISIGDTILLSLKFKRSKEIKIKIPVNESNLRNY